MKIRIFKNMEFWESLSKYNKDIIEVYNKIDKKDCTWWFDPNRVSDLEIRVNFSTNLLRLTPNAINKRFKLIMHPSNYLTLWLINLLYSDNKDILIEDIYCGMGRLIFYLSKLGFTNFHAIDNFSQIKQYIFEALMKKGNIKNYRLNNEEFGLAVFPKIINLVGYPFYFKPEGAKEKFPLNCELVCMYPQLNIQKTFIEKILIPNNYVKLCSDEDTFQIAYCNKDIYNKFYNKIKEYKINEY